MRTYEEYRWILRLWEEGVNQSEIERITQLPRPTIQKCLRRFNCVDDLEAAWSQITRIQVEEPFLLHQLKAPQDSSSARHHSAYAYLLGLYLGDGSISRVRHVYRLRISLDARYPNIIEDCIHAIGTLLPENQVGIVKKHIRQGTVTCVDISGYYKFWHDIFPQHGVGRKHDRRISPEQWQQRIIDKYPLEFWKGLYHSDGSRFSNIVNGTDYPRYQFTNMSRDIIRLFCDTSDKLELHWTEKIRKPKSGADPSDVTTDIFISKRKDVEYLDREVGPKR